MGDTDSARYKFDIPHEREGAFLHYIDQHFDELEPSDPNCEPIEHMFSHGFNAGFDAAIRALGRLVKEREHRHDQ